MRPAILLLVLCGCTTGTGRGSSSSSGGGGSSSSASSGRDCAFVTTASSAAASGGAQWDCLGRACWSPPTSPAVTQRFVVRDLVQRNVVTGVTVKVCARTDVDCAAPADTKVAGPSGAVELALPTTTGLGFDGFLEVSGGTAVTTLYYPAPPIVEAISERAILVFLSSQLNLFASIAGTQLDATRGHVALAAVDCAGLNAGGVHFTADTADGSTTASYTRNNIPSTADTETDGSGAGGFINLPAGPVTLTGTLPSSSRTLGTLRLHVRAGAVTSATLPPSP